MSKITIEKVKELRTEWEESLFKFGETSLAHFIEQKLRIAKDLLENCKTFVDISNYCCSQISLFKTSAGYLLPVFQAEYIIDTYHEILNKEKEYRK